MDNKNIFSGINKQSRYALRIYQLLMSKEWFTYKDIAQKCLYPKKMDWKRMNVSDVDGYGEMKKAFGNVREALFMELGGDFIEEQGNNRAKEYRYVGEKEDPLSFYLETCIKKDIEEYYQFCQDSAGFFPSSWLEYFMGKTFDLYQINTSKSSGKSVIGASIDRGLKNIEMLPKLYECVRDKKVVEIERCIKYKDAETLVFHPHFLKEYNGRWWVVGHAEGKEPKEGYLVALDRIVSLKLCRDVDYVETKNVKYPDFFNDLVGVTYSDEKKQDIRLRLYSSYLFGLVETKPIHQSQTTSLPFDEECGFGEVMLALRPNNEFYGRILQLGPDAEIIEPKSVRDKIVGRISTMLSRYE